MQQRKPLGVIGIQCPDEKTLLSFVSMVASAVIHGNTVVAITGEHYPTIALKMCEVMKDFCMVLFRLDSLFVCFQELNHKMYFIILYTL